MKKKKNSYRLKQVVRVYIWTYKENFKITKIDIETINKLDKLAILDRLLFVPNINSLYVKVAIM